MTPQVFVGFYIEADQRMYEILGYAECSDACGHETGHGDVLCYGCRAPLLDRPVEKRHLRFSEMRTAQKPDGSKLFASWHWNYLNDNLRVLTTGYEGEHSAIKLSIDSFGYPGGLIANPQEDFAFHEWPSCSELTEKRQVLLKAVGHLYDSPRFRCGVITLG